jgi:hypothetical protein
MSPTLYIWAPDDGDRPDEPNSSGSDAELAACRWVESHWASMDHPTEVFVRVDDIIGHRFEFVVRAERSTVFRALAIE